MQHKAVWVGILIAIVIATVSLLGFQVHLGGNSFGSSVNGGKVTDYDAVNTTAGYWVGSTNIVNSSLYGTLTRLLLGTASANIGTIPTVASCGAATSTLFIVANPFAATSTATVTSINASTQATSTQLLIGTTTKAAGYGLASTDVSPSLIDTTVATGTQLDSSSGITVGSLGYTSASTLGATFRTIVVGPNDSVAGYATSTYGNAGALNYSTLGSLSACTYKIEWKR